MKILIAENDPHSRETLCKMVRKWGYEPVAVENGRNAWEILQQPDAPRLALLNRTDSEMDGIEVCRAARRMEPAHQPYLLLLTDQNDGIQVVHCLEQGANDCIVRPYNDAELRARIAAGKRTVEIQSKLIAALDALEFQAMHDSLTGAFNRRAILDMLGKELSRLKRLGNTLSVGMLDMDNFKVVNDTYGHQVGDDVLIGFVERIQNSLRVYDYMGRYGGEEFLIVAPGSNGTSGESLYERLRAATESAPICTRRGDVKITVSIGVAAADPESVLDNLLAKADNALYEAKSQGRNCVVYSETLNANHMENPKAAE